MVNPDRSEIRTQSQILYEAFSAYAGDSMKQTMFSRRLKGRGFTTTAVNGCVFWKGIGLKTKVEDQGRG
jgi:hypothetical protein